MLFFHFFAVPVASSWTELGPLDNVESAVNNTLHQLLDTMRQEMSEGSGFVFRAILTLDLNISKIKLGESAAAKSVSKSCDESPSSQISCSKFGHNFEFDLSQIYNRKKKHRKCKDGTTYSNAILDIKMSDDCCFVYAIAAFLYQNNFDTLDKKEDANSYTELILNNFNINDIRFPTPFKDIEKFVIQNPHLNININIFSIKEDELVLVTPNIIDITNPGERNVNLLALYPKIEFDNRNNELELPDVHFVLINNIETLFSKKDKTGRLRSKTVCHLCHATFTSCESEKFLKHKKFCTNVKSQFQDMPEKNYKLKFDESDFDKQYLNEYIIFYDFECLLKDTDNTCEKCLTICKCIEDRKSFSEIKQMHVPILYNLHVIDNQNKIIDQKSKYCPKGDAAHQLLKYLFRNQDRWREEMTGDEEKIHLSMQQKKEILKKQNNRCRHCRKKCSFEKDDLVVDHSHYNGTIHGISHNLCNLNRMRRKKIPIFAHNAMGYDSHFILDALVKYRKKENIYLKVLPYNLQQYRAIYAQNFCFLDSYQFLFSGLDSLMKDYTKRKQPSEMTIINQSNLALDENNNFSSVRRDFLLRKGLIPWKIVTSRRILKEKRDHLPDDLNMYHSNLNNSTPSREELQKAQEFYKEFKCRSLLDYLKIYCQTDVLILAEIFCSMRNEIWQWAEIDIVHFVGLPAAAFCVFKKMSKSKIGLISDTKMLSTVLSGIRGGMSFVSTRVIRACPKHNPDVHLIYCDANNLYGYCQTKKLPSGNFKFVANPENVAKDLISNYNPEDKTGYIMKVDLVS